jgi:hypothetical protein
MFGGLAILVTVAVMYLWLSGTTPPKPGAPAEQAKSTQPDAAKDDTKAATTGSAGGGQAPQGSAAVAPAENKGKSAARDKGGTPASSAARSGADAKARAPESSANPPKTEQSPGAQSREPAAKPKDKPKGDDGASLRSPAGSADQAIGVASQSDQATRASSWPATVVPGTTPSDGAKAQTDRRDRAPPTRRRQESSPRDTHPEFNTTY